MRRLSVKRRCIEYAWIIILALEVPSFSNWGVRFLLSTQLAQSRYKSWFLSENYKTFDIIRHYRLNLVRFYRVKQKVEALHITIRLTLKHFELYQ